MAVSLLLCKNRKQTVSMILPDRLSWHQREAARNLACKIVRL